MYESAPVDVASYVALSFEEVLSARTLSHNGYMVVAVLTTPLFSASERIALKEQIRLDIAERLNVDINKVLVTFDMEIYRSIDGDNVDSDTVVQKAIDRSL